jgi:hypothetical protein
MSDANASPADFSKASQLLLETPWKEGDGKISRFTIVFAMLAVARLIARPNPRPVKDSDSC